MSTETPQTTTKMSTRTKAALWLLIGPTALYIVLIIAFAMVNWVFLSTPTTTTTYCDTGYSVQEGIYGDGCTTTPTDSVETVRAILNVILFLGGALAFISWLPGLIIGIVLLATAPKNKSSEGK